MARFSISVALGDALSLVRRRPGAVAVWGAVQVAPVALLSLATLPLIKTLGQGFSAEQGPSSEGRAVEAMIQLQLFSYAIQFLQFALYAWVVTAVIRSILRPDDGRWFFLRAGVDELRILVLAVMFVVGLYVMAFIGGLLVLATLLAVGPLGDMAAVGVLSGLVLALIGGLAWITARASLVGPASLSLRTFAFGEGWRASGSVTVRLIGLVVGVTALHVLISALILAGLVGLIAVGPGLDSVTSVFREGANPFDGMAAWFRRHWVWLAAPAVISIPLQGVVTTLIAAPFASAFRQISTGRALELN